MQGATISEADAARFLTQTTFGPHTCRCGPRAGLGLCGMAGRTVRHAPASPQPPVVLGHAACRHHCREPKKPGRSWRIGSQLLGPCAKPGRTNCGNGWPLPCRKSLWCLGLTTAPTTIPEGIQLSRHAGARGLWQVPRSDRISVSAPLSWGATCRICAISVKMTARAVFPTRTLRVS